MVIASWSQTKVPVFWVIWKDMKPSLHESYISLLNQLFDGKGDKMTLAKNVERPVPRNATSLSIGVQQKSFCDAIFGLSETLWLDNGFGEKFIFSAARLYRYLYAETYMSHFAYACKTKGKNGISRLISALCVNCLISIPEYSQIIDYSIIWMCIWCGLLQKLYKIKKSELLNSKVYSKV